MEDNNKLGEREKNIMDLIGKLAEVAEDEASTQEAIENIMMGLKSKTREMDRMEMEEAERNDIPTPKVEFPSNPIKTEIEQELMRMAEEKSGTSPKEKCQHKCKNGDGEHCNCGHSHQSSRPSNSSLFFTRIREVKKPTKAHPTDAGIDFFVPDLLAWNDDFKDTVKKYSKNKGFPNIDGTTFDGLKFDGNVLEVSPNAHVAIPSGIKTIIPQGLAMMMVNKSGVATKMKLDHSACLIDSEYRDELIFCFFNHNQDRIVIEPGMKLTQGLIVPVYNVQMQEVLNCVYEDLGSQTNRGGGFGSSGCC